MGGKPSVSIQTERVQKTALWTTLIAFTLPTSMGSIPEMKEENSESVFRNCQLKYVLIITVDLPPRHWWWFFESKKELAHINFNFSTVRNSPENSIFQQKTPIHRASGKNKMYLEIHCLYSYFLSRNYKPSSSLLIQKSNTETVPSSVPAATCPGWWF